MHFTDTVRLTEVCEAFHALQPKEQQELVARTRMNREGKWPTEKGYYLATNNFSKRNGQEETDAVQVTTDAGEPSGTD